MVLPNFGFSAFRKTKVMMEVMNMKCRVSDKRTSESPDGYCLRCEKIAADVDAEWAIGVEVVDEIGH